jgi:TonB family protein
MVQPMPFDPGEMPRTVELDVSQCVTDTGVRPPQQVFMEAHVHKAAVPLPTNRKTDYSDELKRRRVRGQVAVQYVVDESGSTVPCMAKILTASDPRLAEAVTRALTDWKFEPAKIFGQPVAAVVQQSFSFPDRE